MVERIVLAHGGGGTLMRELIEKAIAPALGGLEADLPDASPIPQSNNLVFTTDSFVVKPLFFPGGDIGKLSVCGTINDLAVSGAAPLALSLAVIIEEGLELDLLRRVLESVGRTASECGARIITGDTKVVAKGEADQLFLTTAGVGKRILSVSPNGLREGDQLLLSGGLAEHGIAVISKREGIEFDTSVQSDAQSIWPFVKALIDEGIEIHAMRDPTRGGAAAACVELAEASQVSVVLHEASIPIQPSVYAACEMLGFDPLTVANEGKFIAVVPESDADRALAVLRAMPRGEKASLIGQVTSPREKSVYLNTRFGGERIIEMPYGEELPRIC